MNDADPQSRELESAESEQAERLYQAAWTQRCKVLHLAYVSQRYHRKRQRFFDLLDKCTKALTVALGASLIGQALKEQVPLLASAISVLGLMALVFGYGDRKQAHKELAEQAAHLAAKIEELPLRELNDEVARGWEAEHSRLNAKEPPALATLVKICEWEQAQQNGNSQHVPRPPFLSRLIADFF